MKRIGIITHYYNTTNYGGSLQAYALPYFLNNNGFESKQICYDYWSDSNIEANEEDKKKKHTIFRLFKQCLTFFTNKLINRQRIMFIERFKLERSRVFSAFQVSAIPHTEKEYFENNLDELNSQFDYFITGSDQVFNFKWFRKAFWLEFARKNKISYSASMALNRIPDDKKEFVKKSLESFKAIGVREDKTVSLLSALVSRKIELNVDPTFLLSKNEWDNVSANRLISDDYVFCYFLGDNSIERKLAKAYAKKHRLKLVCIPVVIKKYKLIDRGFGDFNMLYATPEDFISLVKYANVIFTDSFHSCVFSLIYNKEFAVFNRDSKGTMNTRIESLMNLFHVSRRFFDKKEKCNLTCVEEVLKENTDYESREFDMLKESSVSFLLHSLKD